MSGQVIANGVAAFASGTTTKEYDWIKLEETIATSSKMVDQFIANWEVTRMRKP